MNWEQISGNWKQAMGKAQQQWGKLTDDDWRVVNGRREQLAGLIEQRYGVAKEEAERQLAEWQRQASDLWFDNGVKAVKAAVAHKTAQRAAHKTVFKP